jgi:hypothetical protein
VAKYNKWNSHNYHLNCTRGLDCRIWDFLIFPKPCLLPLMTWFLFPSITDIFEFVSTITWLLPLLPFKQNTVLEAKDLQAGFGLE